MDHVSRIEQPAGSRRLDRVLHAAAVSLKAHAWLLGLTALYWSASEIALAMQPGARLLDFSRFAFDFVAFSLPVLLLALVTVKFIRLVAVERPRRPTLALLRYLGDFLGSPVRLIHGLPLVVSLAVIIQTYTQIKYNIPAFQPFQWDETFMRLDRWLHFGWHPWELLQPLFGHPAITFVINFAYNIWFLVMWAFWVLLAFATRPSELRTRFFLSFVLIWSVGGSLLAVLLSSAGPCYYGFLGLGEDPFAPLMAYLHEAHRTIPLWIIDTQALLWDAHVGKQNVVGGISAMPSLHNASTLLFALTAWRIDRRLGWAMIAYTLLIFIGSVHLAWHYAIDAYLGWALAGAIWWLSGRFARWNEQRGWTRDLRELAERLDAANGSTRPA